MLNDALRLAWKRLRHAQSQRAQLRCADAVERSGLRLEPDTYCDYAFSVLRSLDAFALPVTVGKRFLGFFTLADVFKCADRDPALTYVGSVMTPAAECGFAAPNASLEDAQERLLESPYSMLPVLDRNTTLLGFVTEEGIGRLSKR